jgi:hypothetical protein
MSVIQDQLPARHAPGEEPLPETIRGECPLCHSAVVSRIEYHTGKGFLIAWMCWGSLEEPPRCDYARVL